MYVVERGKQCGGVTVIEYWVIYYSFMSKFGVLTTAFFTFSWGSDVGHVI